MPTALAAPPIQTPLIEGPKEPFITKVWASWLRALVDRAQSAPAAVTGGSVLLSGQSASIGLTSLVPSASGLYRVSYQFRVTTPATTSSSLQLTITSTEGAVTCTQSSAAYTGNVTNAPQSGAFIVRCDPSTVLQYSTTYASVGATAMVYTLAIRVEAL